MHIVIGESASPLPIIVFTCHEQNTMPRFDEQPGKVLNRYFTSIVTGGDTEKETQT